MTGRTHLAYGMGTGIVAMTAMGGLGTDTLLGALVVAGSSIGSLVPDIDSEGSMISRKVPLVPKLMNKLFGHRGFIHTPLCLYIVMIIGTVIMSLTIDQWQIYIPALFAFCIGYATHLMLDTFTKGGTMLLYPFKKKYYHITNMKTGGAIETIAVVILGIGMAGYFAHHLL